MRSRKALYSFGLSALSQLISTALALVVRRCFIQKLGIDLLGLNSLYSSIVSFLSLAELGFGQSVAMCLYKSLSDNDTDKVARYMQYLKKVYVSVGITIIVIGLILSPFVYIVTDVGYKRSFIAYTFILYVISTAVSYFFSYKKILLSADQNNYIVAGIQLIFKIILNGLQLIAVLKLENYFAFLMTISACNLLENAIASRVCDKKYPYILAKTSELGTDDKRDLKGKIGGLIFYKIGNYVIQSSDNIIISAILGTTVVAYFTNFNLITTIMYSVFSNVGFSSLAGLGNILYSDRQNLKSAFGKLMFIQHIIFSVSTMGFVAVSRTFVHIMFGYDSYISLLDIISMAIAYDIRGYSFALESLRNSAGLYQYDRKWNIIAAVVNIIISVGLAKPLGITGIMLGTIVSFFIKEMIIVPEIVFSEILPNEKKWYFGKVIKHYGFELIYLVITLFVYRAVGRRMDVIGFIGGGFSVVIIGAIGIVITERKTEEYKALADTFKQIFTLKAKEK